jgi:mono/diheme cytochrome c family protein
MKIIIILFLLCLLLISCNDSEETTAPTVTIQPKLSSIQTEIFDKSCGMSSCHGGSAGGLNLQNGNSYNQLVNVASNNDGAHTPPFKRVLPGNPDSSFLIIKLTNPNATTQGSMMPQSGSALSSEKINAIRQWISNGAPND